MTDPGRPPAVFMESGRRTLSLAGVAIVALAAVLIVGSVVAGFVLSDATYYDRGCPAPGFDECAWRCESTGESDAAYWECMAQCSLGTNGAPAGRLPDAPEGADTMVTIPSR